MNEYKFEITKSTSKIFSPHYKVNTPHPYFQKNIPKRGIQQNMSGCSFSTYLSPSHAIHNETKKLSIAAIANKGVSVITCTNRRDFSNNILENFLTQTYLKKELIIILNNNGLDLEHWRKMVQKFDHIHVYQLDETVTLGHCLNYAVEKATYDFIAKFDDDDYYGPNYLADSLQAFTFTQADVVGKAATYVYFKDRNILAIRNGRRANRYVARVEGPTLIMKKEIFKTIKFSDKNLGEDVQFCKDCFKVGFKIYSHNIFHHTYMRYGFQHGHTWSVGDDYYLKLCKIIGEVADYKTYINTPSLSEKNEGIF